VRPEAVDVERVADLVARHRDGFDFGADVVAEDAARPQALGFGDVGNRLEVQSREERLVDLCVQFRILGGVPFLLAAGQEQGERQHDPHGVADPRRAQVRRAHRSF
jgi:hypothetical protein